MVSAIYPLAAALASAFLLGLLHERQRAPAYAITLGVLGFMTLTAASWVWGFAQTGQAGFEIYTAGVAPPFAISLRLGLAEASLMLLINLTGLLSAIHLQAPLLAHGRRAMAVLLIAVMALGGLVMTRDLFNLFVFIELIVIATGGLVLLSDDPRAVVAGFKYLIISQLVTVFLLIGIIFAYHGTGTLNIDGMAMTTMGLASGGALAFFLMFIAVVIETKPFPANGWALDIYESAHPAFAAIFSAASAAAALFAVDKLLLIGGSDWLPIATGIGILSFVGANLLALPQTNDRRLLGYSSIAQTGLVLVVLGQRDLLGDHTLYVAGGLLLANAVAKAGLFWLSDLIPKREPAAWAALRHHPLALFAFATLLALLVGLPPFPSFYAKWDLVHPLADAGRLWLLGLILFGTLLEAGYLFRWFGYSLKREAPALTGSLVSPRFGVVLVAVAAAWLLALLWGELSVHDNLLLAVPLAFALAFLALDWLPARVKNALAITGLVAYFALTYTDYDPLRMIFAVIFLLGSALTMLAGFDVQGRRPGFYPSVMLMLAGLIMLIRATDSFAFFAAWEVLTIGSYFLILRGKRSEPHALSYLLFSFGGALAMLAGFALAAQGAPSIALVALAQVAESVAPWVFLLLAIGFMTKTAAIGLHIWLPGAHAEAELDVSPMVSGILLKAGLYGLMVLLLAMGTQRLAGVDLVDLLLWIGALTAFLGNLMAIFQEDAKRLLAYSSIGQMGYAIFGLALMNHLGWLMALMFVINHYIYKSMLFLAVGGVARRTGTRQMFLMGGLITLMPLSFIAVMIGIIAMSGVPPLSGFGGRWIFYNAILATDARLPIALIFLSGPIAFLYLFRLIHTIFLGQLKDEHRQVKEAPFWILLPQMIYVAILIVAALVPGLLLRHVDQYLTEFFPFGALNWEGLRITSDFGYWNPVAIMLTIGVIFILLLSWLLFVNRRAQKVKQFNIVFSAERPYRPETTHFAWNFFAPYRKAMGFLVQPLVTRFWDLITQTLHGIGEMTRRIYNGNAQTYAFHLIGFVVVVFLLGPGGTA